MIAITISIVLGDIAVPKNYSIFQQVTEDSVLSGKLSEKSKLTELKFKTLKLVILLILMVEN